MKNRRWVAAVLAAAAILFFTRMRVRVDPDVFFHLKEGGRVLAEHRLPTVEEYSFTRAGKPMVATEWLSGAVFAGLFNVGGYPLVAAFCVLLIVAALWFLTAVWDRDLPEPAAALLTALAAFGFLNFALAKVQNFTFFFFALYIYWCRRWEKGARWAPWAMAAGLAVWVNLHGGFMLGWVLLGGVCGLDFLKDRRLKTLAPWAAGTFACFLHPDGAMAFVYPLWFMAAAPAGRGLVSEWRPLALQISALPYVLILVAALASRVDRFRSRFPWVLMGFIFLIMGLRTRKMMPFFALAECAAAGLALKGAKLDKTRARLVLGGALAVLLAIGAVEVGEARSLSDYGPVSDWERQYPKEAVARFIARDSGRRLFHEYDWGGYLVFKLPAGDHVFIDGRLDPYWTLLPDYETMIHAAPGWEKLFSSYRIGAALVSPGSALAQSLKASKDWTSAGTDGRAVLFERRR